MSKYFLNLVIALVFSFLFFDCSSLKKSKNKPYDYGWVPRKYKDIENNYNKYSHLSGCMQGETIASIGAGNGTHESTISCFVNGITWYLQEIDSGKLNQFHDVRSYFEQLMGGRIDAKFNMTIGTEKRTNLPKNTFDRIIMNNVYHELSDRKSMLEDIAGLLNDNGKLVIMEPMARKPGEKHANCNHIRLYEPDFLEEMEQFGYQLLKKVNGEKISFLIYYTFILEGSS